MIRIDQHEEMELTTMASQSYPEAGPSRLVSLEEHTREQFS